MPTATKYRIREARTTRVWAEFTDGTDPNNPLATRLLLDHQIKTRRLHHRGEGRLILQAWGQRTGWTDVANT